MYFFAEALVVFEILRHVVFPVEANSTILNTLKADRRTKNRENFPPVAEWIDGLQKNGYDRFRTPTHAEGVETFYEVSVILRKVRVFLSIYLLITPYGVFLATSFPSDEATVVEIGVYVENMGNFQSTSMDYEADVYFEEWWHDERLAHTGVKLPGFSDEGLISKIWRPDLYFPNSKDSRKNLLTVPNMYMRISEDGSVFYNVRVHLKLTCDMDFRNYPLDHQMCMIRIISYGHVVDELVARWQNSSTALTVNSLTSLAELRLARIEKVCCDGRYPTGNYSCLEAQFYLDRQFTFYLIQNYIPTGIIVCVSWISFWIDPASIPGRVSLSVSSLLTLATLSAAIMQKLPPVTYTKAIDTWLGVCMIFVFGTLLEFAWVNTLLTGGEKNKAKDEESDQAPQEQPSLKPLALIASHLPVRCRNEAPKTFAWRIDRCSRVLFPGAFLIFAAAYWFVYGLLQTSGNISGSCT